MDDVRKMEFGERLKYIMEQQNTSPQLVAAHFGVASGTVMNWIRKKSMLPMERIGELADFLHTDVRFLLTGSHEERLEDLSPEDEKMLREFRQLSEVRQAEVREYIKIILRAEKSEDRLFVVKKG